jgi:hypothetical protein
MDVTLQSKCNCRRVDQSDGKRTCAHRSLINAIKCIIIFIYLVQGAFTFLVHSLILRICLLPYEVTVHMTDQSYTMFAINPISSANISNLKGMWEEQSQKYWKEKEAAKNRTKNVILACVALLVLTVVGYFINKFLVEREEANKLYRMEEMMRNEEHRQKVSALIKTDAASYCSKYDDIHDTCTTDICKDWEFQVPRYSMQTTLY